jgi:selenocysteine lyase/cysteine desulfurase
MPERFAAREVNQTSRQVWQLFERKALPKGVPFQTGEGTARLVSPGWVIWAKAPDKFEAGTPAIVNVSVFARVLRGS